ncbi:MAG: hypothetical protein ACWIPJ_04585, partial [Polaribacter sp.]
KFIAVATGTNNWYTSAAGNNANLLWQGETGINNPCPQGYRLPTRGELQEEINKFSPRNGTGAFNSKLKVSYVGLRNINGNINQVAIRGFYWSSTFNGIDRAFRMITLSVTNYIPSAAEAKASGFSVRCIKN